MTNEQIKYALDNIEKLKKEPENYYKFIKYLSSIDLNSVEEKQRKEIKKLLKSEKETKKIKIKTIYVVHFISVVMMYLSMYIVPMLALLIFITGMSSSILYIGVIVALIMTFLFLRKQFGDNESNMRKILSNVLIGYFVYSVICTVTQYLFQSIASSVPTIFFLIFYLSLPLITFYPIVNKLNKGIKTNKKTIYIMMLILTILCVYGEPIMFNLGYYIQTNQSQRFLIENIKTVLNPLYIFTFYKPAVVISLILPMMVNSLKQEEQEHKDIKFKNIVLVFLLLTYIAISTISLAKLTNAESNEKSERTTLKIPSETSINEYMYCINPYITKTRIYYEAMNNSECTGKTNLYSFNPKDGVVTPHAEDVKNTYFYSKQKKSLFFIIDYGVFETYAIDKTGQVKYFKDSHYLFSNGNKAYTYNFEKNRIESIDLDTLELKTELNFKNYEDPIYANSKYIYYYGSDNEYNVYKYDLNNRKESKIGSPTKGISGTANIYTYLDQRQMIDNIIYVFDQKDYSGNEYYLYIFDTINGKIDKQVVTVDEDIYSFDIVDKYNNKLYLKTVSYDYSDGISSEESKIIELDLKTLETNTIIENYYNNKIDTSTNKYIYSEKEETESKIKIIDDYMYYSNIDDNNKIYRINLNSKEKEVYIDIENAMFLDKIDEITYYLAIDKATMKNSIYSIKDEITEKIL